MSEETPQNIEKDHTAPAVVNKPDLMVKFIITEAEKMKISRLELLYALKALFCAFVAEEDRNTENRLLKDMDKEIRLYRKARTQRKPAA